MSGPNHAVERIGEKDRHAIRHEDAEGHTRDAGDKRVRLADAALGCTTQTSHEFGVDVDDPSPVHLIGPQQRNRAEMAGQQGTIGTDRGRVVRNVAGKVELSPGPGAISTAAGREQPDRGSGQAGVDRRRTDADGAYFKKSGTSRSSESSKTIVRRGGSARRLARTGSGTRTA